MTTVARPSAVALVTVVRGRHDHLERQLWGLRRQTRRPDLHVVVAMDDPEVESIAHRELGDHGVHVHSIALRGGRLPLAAARNLGVKAAVDAGADALVLLDVDCIPSPSLVERYAAVLSAADGGIADSVAGAPVVLSGEVAYLPEAPAGIDYRELDLAAMARPHPARPALGPEDVVPADDLRLFWSLSFALTVTSWRTIGGFDESYVGYGGEDTDFAQRLGAAGGRLLWVGGARADHQHHPTSSPPVQHLHDIIENANRFADRWGWWPMEGWLDAFAEMGLAERVDGAWHVITEDARSRSWQMPSRRRLAQLRTR